MISAVLISVALLLGAAIRSRVPMIERARVPASVVGGVVGCVIAQAILGASDRWDEDVTAILATLKSWGGILISVVFAGLLLAPAERAAPRTRDVWQQGIVAWVIILGQLAIGLVAMSLAILPMYPELPAQFGQFIEVTMAGGFGSANSMATILAAEPYRFPEARDLLVFGATAGLLWGVLSGLFLARWGQSRGWTAAQREREPTAEDASRVAAESPLAAAASTTARSGIEPILLQLCFLLVALGIGMLMQSGVTELSRQLDLQFDPVAKRYGTNLGNLPLFFFALIGGWLVRTALRVLRIQAWLDRDLIHQLCGVAMDVLIVSSLAAIGFDQIRTYLWPVLLMLALGSAWSAFCLVWVSPRLLPRKYWFELGLINYGFSTAATAQGMMFLKIVDPKLRSGAAETYALGAPLTAPFIGGGVLTFAVLPWTIQSVGLMPMAIVSGALVVVLYLAGHRLSATHSKLSERERI